MRSSTTAARGRETWLVAAFLAVIASSGIIMMPGTARAQSPASGHDGDKASEPAPPAGPATTAPPATEPGAPDATNPAGTTNPADATGAPAAGTEDVDDGEAPVNVRLRRLEQQVQALKERAWRAKARVGMLKEAVLGGGVGANATIVHVNKMGSSYRLIKLVYALDGTQIFARNDDSGKLHENEDFEILTGPIAPGSHTLSVLALYRGHGYGVFKYLNKYKFTVRSSHTFTVTEGNATRIEAVAFERGGVTTELDQRPAMDFKVSQSKGPGGN